MDVKPIKYLKLNLLTNHEQYYHFFNRTC
uniref:Uncharacterized protein n=1 Tax=Anguilla anguilla TaxID=7936 RepID=A0A0E9TUV8_ANGAN